MCYNGLSSRATDRVPARPFMFTRHLFGGPRRQAVLLTPPRSTSNSPLFCAFCALLQKSKAHPLYPQSLPASLQKPRVCRHHRFSIPDAFSQPSHPQTCLPRASKGQPANLPTCSYTFTLSVHTICVQEQSPSPFPSTTSPLYTKTPGCHPQRSPRSPLVTRHSPLSANSSTLLHHSEGHPLPFQSLAHSLCVYPGCHPQRPPRSPLVTRHSPLSANSSTLLHHSEGHPLPFQSLAHSLCVYPGCHPQRSPRSPLVTRHSPLSANSSTLLHHNEGHPLPFQSLAHSLCVYPGCHPQRSPRSPLVTRHSPLSANSSTLLHHSEGHPLPFQSLAHSLCVYPGCHPQRSPRSPLVTRHSPLSAFAPARSAGLRSLGMPLFAQHGFAGGFQGEGQRFLGDAVDEGADQPAQAGGDVAGERSDFALHVSAAVAFFDSPPGFHAPEVPTVVAGRFLPLAGLTGVFHFGDAHGGAAAVRPCGCVAEIMHVMLGVEHRGDDFVAPEAQKHAEVIAIAGKDLGALDVRREVSSVLIVVLENVQNIVDFCAGNEHHSHPVMNERVRTLYCGAVVPGLELLHFHFAAAECGVRIAALRFGQSIDPEEIAAALDLGVVARVGQAEIAVKSLAGCGFQFARLGNGGGRGGRSEQERCKQERRRAMSAGADVDVGGICQVSGARSRHHRFGSL